MKRSIAILLCMAISSAAVAQDATLATKLFSQSPVPLALAKASGTPASTDKAATGESNASERLKPGRAMLLSAIMPGAGEAYSGQTIRAAAFFALEIAAWAGVIYYYNQGMQADKDFKRYIDGYDSAGVRVQKHFYEEVYRDVEFQLAQNGAFGDSGSYTRSQIEWDQESWDTKIHFLPDAGFTHELPSGDERDQNKSQDQQFYEMIGKYIHQFGFGWIDVFQGIPGAVTAFWGDDPSTPQYDNNPTFGSSHVGGGAPAKYSALYMDMRYKSNNFLDNSAVAIQVVMLNHVASALHAGFTVKAMNQQADAQVGFRTINYDKKQVTVGGLNFQW